MFACSQSPDWEQANNHLTYFGVISCQTPFSPPPLTNPFGLTDVGRIASPSLVDIDGDGDLDAFVGNWDGNTLLYRIQKYGLAAS